MMKTPDDDFQSPMPVEHFFRQEASNLIAVLARTYGLGMLEVIEDVVQESLLDALRCWRIQGVPDSPAAWMHRVARNKLIDSLRRERRVEMLYGAPDQDELIRPAGRPPVSFEPDELQDSVLRMIFACCHPMLDRGTQLALTLKLVCGFGDREIARGLLLTPAAAKKRVTRGKRTLQMSGADLTMPALECLVERLDAVHAVLYLMFNEGYASHHGDAAVDEDLCEEAARLCHLLCHSDVGTPSTEALLSLLLFHASRLSARSTRTEPLLLLDEQDRSLWDRDMIGVAEYWLQRSARGNDVSRYHLEAAIARMHCSAASVETTDWVGIARSYDLLASMAPSPIYQLNLAIATDRAGQGERALSLLQSLEPAMKDYPWWYCAIADVLFRQNRRDEAVQRLSEAIPLAPNTIEKARMEARLREWES